MCWLRRVMLLLNQFAHVGCSWFAEVQQTDRQTDRQTDTDRCITLTIMDAASVTNLSLKRCSTRRREERCYSNTTVYYGIHERSECILVDSGVTNLIYDRRSCVDFTLEVEANVARCVYSSVNKPGVKRNSGL